MNRKKAIRILLTVTLVICGMITGCGKKSNSIMPIVDITMKTTNDDLKEAFGDKYDDSEFDDGKTVLNTAFKDIDVTVHRRKMPLRSSGWKQLRIRIIMMLLKKRLLIFILTLSWKIRQM